MMLHWVLHLAYGLQSTPQNIFHSFIDDPNYTTLYLLTFLVYCKFRFKMYSLADPSGRKTALVAMRNSIYLIPLGFLAYDCE
jgi:hypothetical protein